MNNRLIAIAMSMLSLRVDQASRHISVDIKVIAFTLGS